MTGVQTCALPILLSADGGHPGDPRHAAIRRWTAPRAGLVAVRGELNHPGEAGDGVRARVVSSRNGELGHWLAYHTNTPTKLSRVAVQRGDTLDFVTDCRANENTDSFQWAPTVRYAAGTIPAGEGTPSDYSAKTDFGGPAKEAPRPALNAWERYAQVLLLANELVFVD